MVSKFLSFPFIISPSPQYFSSISPPYTCAIFRDFNGLESYHSNMHSNQSERRPSWVPSVCTPCALWNPKILPWAPSCALLYKKHGFQVPTGRPWQKIGISKCTRRAPPTVCTWNPNILLMGAWNPDFCAKSKKMRLKSTFFAQCSFIGIWRKNRDFRGPEIHIFFIRGHFFRIWRKNWDFRSIQMLFRCSFVIEAANTLFLLPLLWKKVLWSCLMLVK